MASGRHYEGGWLGKIVSPRTMPPCEGGYKEFRLGDLFDVEKTWIYGKNKQYTTRFQLPTEESVAVVSGVTTNNGVNYYTKDQLLENEIFSNSLTISTRGEYSGTVTYHDGQFALANNILVMATPGWSREAKLYLASHISKLGYGGYSGYPRKETLKNDIVVLPTTSTGEIDFLTMEKFVKELEQECLSQIFAKNERTLDCYLKAANVADTTLTNEEKKAIDQIENMRTTFSTITAEKIFSVKGNPQLNKENFIFAENAEYPYFTRTVKNNGFLGYVKYLDEAHKIDGKVLAVGMLGMQFFYVDHDYYSGQFTKSIRPKDFELDEALALWFISWFNQSSNYYKSLLVRDFEKAFNNTKITLPIDADGKIDFALMRMYISAIKKIVIQEVRERMAKEYAAYHQVIGETE